MKRFFLLSTYFALTLIFNACSPNDTDVSIDNNNAGEPIDVSMSIATRSIDLTNAPADLDASGLDVPSNNGELINSWFVVFTHNAGSKKGRIAAIATRNASLTTPVQAERFTTQIPEGKYIIYAFANITKQQVEAAAGATLTAGATMPDLENTVWKFEPQEVGGVQLPMSNKMEATFTSHNTPSFGIEVVRMVSKVRFLFNNETTADMKVAGYRMLPLSNTAYLIPRADASGLPSIPSAGQHNVVYQRTLTSGKKINLSVGARLVGNDDVSFYASESAVTPAVHPTGRYVVSFDTERDIDGISHREEFRFSYVSDVFACMRRNNFILQPITFTDWVLEPTARFYPPIGGYPDVTVESDESWKECYVSFESPNGGVFSVNPRLHNMANPNNWIYLTDTSVITGSFEVDGHVYEGYHVEIDDINGIFATQPKPDLGGDYIGTFNGKTGRARIRFYVSIKISDTINRLYQRDIYIVNK